MFHSNSPPQFKVKIDPVANNHPVYFLSKAARIWIDWAESHNVDMSQHYGIFVGPSLWKLLQTFLPHSDRLSKWNKDMTVFGMPVMIEPTLDDYFVYFVPGELV